jgi:hypothetical protein
MPTTKLAILLALSTASVTAYGQADAPIDQTPAPIVRDAPGMRPQVTTTQPIMGVWVLSDPNSSVQTVSADAKGTEIRVERGHADVQVHHSAERAQITVDLPDGQVSLLKDGLYTFNAESNTVRVLIGEAEVEKGPNGKPVKIKEDHQLSFAVGPEALRSVDADPQELRADLIQSPRAEGYGNGYAPGPYGDGYPVYPYGYAVYPYWGYPYAYPYFGLGFGYYGGYYGGHFGGFRGGFGRR